MWAAEELHFQRNRSRQAGQMEAITSGKAGRGGGWEGPAEKEESREEGWKEEGGRRRTLVCPTERADKLNSGTQGTRLLWAGR